MRQALSEALLYEVRPGNHDDRYRARQGVHRQCVDQAGGDDDIGVCCDQLGGGGLAALRVLAGDAALDGEIVPLNPAEPPQGVVEQAARGRLPGDDEPDTGAP